jgi:GAF domain-containing protein
MLLNARKMTQSEGGDNILLAIEDITERKIAEQISQLAAKCDAFRITLADVLRPIADPVEIQAATSRVLGKYLGANRVVYFEISGTDYVVERDDVNGVAPLSGSYPIDSFGAKMLAAHRAGRTVSVSDVNADPDLPPEQKAAYAALQISAYIDIPLVKDGEFIAGLAEIQEEFTRLVSADEIMQVVGEKIGAYLNISQCVFGEVDRSRDLVTLEYNWHNLELPDLIGVYQIFPRLDYRSKLKAN